MLDLHTHSTASDGTFPPAELIRLAQKIKLTALGICDHDTTMGIDEAANEAQATGVQFVPGVELSAVHDDTQVHIVGLYVDHKEPTLQQTLADTRDMRNRRNPQIIAKLQARGIDITLEELDALAGGDSVGRPHIAALLIEKKVVTTSNAAFNKYLNPGGAAYVPKNRLSAGNAIAAIRGAGGVPILAHPHQTKLKGDALSRLIGELTALGLRGIEVFCSGYKSSMSTEYSRLARKYELVRSGGSDFHGKNKPRIRLGRGMGSLYVPDDLLAPIKAVASNQKNSL